jgi:hypothetical protein
VKSSDIIFAQFKQYFGINVNYMLLYRQKIQASAIYSLKLDFASSGGHHRQKIFFSERVTNSMKPKRLLALLMAVVTVVSVFTISASAANTEDTYYTYSWKSNSRYDYTPARKKTNATPVYLKTQEYTLPYNGYYAKTLYGTGSQSANRSASASEYWINNYTAYVIRANGTSVSQTGKYVRIRGHYSDTTYSWGDCKIAWSPDTTNASNYTYLN